MTSAEGIWEPISEHEIGGVSNSERYTKTSNNQEGNNQGSFMDNKDLISGLSQSTSNTLYEGGAGTMDNPSNVRQQYSGPKQRSRYQPQEKLESNMIDSPFSGGVVASCEGKETPAQSASLSGRRVKVKAIDTLQSIEIAGKSRQNKVRTSKIDISVGTLESAITRLESVSSQLVAASLVDSYDQFGKYIASVLRGLPIMRVHSVKQKIMSDIMEALAREDTVLCKNDPQYEDPNVQPNFSPATNQATVIDYPKIPNAVALELSTVQVPNLSGVLSASPSTAVTTNVPVPQSFFDKTSSKACQMADGQSLKSVAAPDIATSTTKNISSTAFANEPSSSETPRGQKRRKTSENTTAKKTLSSSETTTHSATTSGDESSMTASPSAGISQEGRDDEQDFEIDIKEGNELEKIKEDPFSFETVICDGTPNIYIKEEAPDPEEDVNDSPAPSPSTAFICHKCHIRCTSSEDLNAHFATAHPNSLLSGLPEPERTLTRKSLPHVPTKIIEKRRDGKGSKASQNSECPTVGSSGNLDIEPSKSPALECCYAGCGLTVEQCPDLNFFRFPVNRPHVLEKWLVNSGNEDIIFLPNEVLFSKRVCDIHFTDDCFTSKRRKILKIDAVPTIMDPDELEEDYISDLKLRNIKNVYNNKNKKS